MEESYPVCVSGIGLCSSLGGYQDACAAFRAGLTRFSPHPKMKVMNPGDEEGEPINIAPAATNLFNYQGVGRLIKMFHNAYLDLQSRMPGEIPKENLTILIALPDPEDRAYEIASDEVLSRDKRLQDYSELITEPLFTRIDPLLGKVPTQLVFGERIAFARILQKATTMLNNGAAQYCLLLVADSLTGDDMLDTLWGSKQLKTSDNPTGFIPGEGALMMLLSANSVAQDASSRLSISCLIDQTIYEKNDSSEDIDKPEMSQEKLESWQGKRLMNVVKPFLTPIYENHYIPRIVSDINGQNKRAMELANLLVGISQNYHTIYRHEEIIPALSFGELGTMMGALAMLSCIASVERGYANTNEFLILLSDDDGKRAAIKLMF